MIFSFSSFRTLIRAVKGVSEEGLGLMGWLTGDAAAGATAEGCLGSSGRDDRESDDDEAEPDSESDEEEVDPLVECGFHITRYIALIFPITR